MNKLDVFCFDVDGTLACHKPHRGPFEEHKVCDDTVIEPVAKVLRALSHEYKIIFVSGRTTSCQKMTEEWIENKLGIYKYILHMRQAGDMRKDSIVKKEIYDNFILPHYNVVGVFDDRLQVCRMLYENGIFCFNVNQGLIEF